MCDALRNLVNQTAGIWEDGVLSTCGEQKIAYKGPVPPADGKVKQLSAAVSGGLSGPYASNLSATICTASYSLVDGQPGTLLRSDNPEYRDPYLTHVFDPVLRPDAADLMGEMHDSYCRDD